MYEMVNQIKLDLTYYQGQDLYSDGTVEDDMLLVAQKYDELELNHVIKEQFRWPYLYHFSTIRQNIVTWLPITKEHRVLEIGSGCGAITGALAQMADHVTCIELSKKRSLINANRNRNHDNIEIKVGNFMDIEPNLTEQYDYITLIGVYEYAECYIDSENPYIDFLTCIKKHLKPDGKIVIAIENRIGMKYIAGCKEDHVSIVGEGLNHYPKSSGVQTFDKKEICALFDAAGFSAYQFFYPYPDYKFPLEIYSDEYLPKQGCLNRNLNNIDQSRVSFFDEADAFDKAIDLGIFDEISNSFEVILNNTSSVEQDAYTVYAGFDNDREAKYAIQTQIVSKDGLLYMKKLPMTKEASQHVGVIKENAKLLAKEYDGSRFLIMAPKSEDTLFDFVTGMTLTQTLDQLLQEGKGVAFYDLLAQYMKEVESISTTYFNMGLVPSATIVKDDKWYLSDCEWIFRVDDLSVDGMNISYLKYRIIKDYLEHSSCRKKMYKVTDFMAHFDLADVQAYEAIDLQYKELATGDYYTLAKAKEEHHRLCLDCTEMLQVHDCKKWDILLKIKYKEDAVVKEQTLCIDEYDKSKVLIELHGEKSVEWIFVSRTNVPCIMGIEKAFVSDGKDTTEFYTTLFHDTHVDGQLLYLAEGEGLTLVLPESDSVSSDIRIFLKETVMDDETKRILALKNEEIAQQKEYMKGLQDNIQLLDGALKDMECSSSWKVTKPLRAISNLLKGKK